MKSLLKLTLSLGLMAVPLMSGTAVAGRSTALIGYVTNEHGEVVRTDNPVSGISECWHTERWEQATEAERQSMAVEGCDNVVAVATNEKARPIEVPMELPEEPRIIHEIMSDEGGALFEFNKAVLTRRSRASLDDLSDRIRSFTRIDRVVIIGHADRLGSDSYNMRLSRKRAEAVRDYLVDKGAADAGQVEIEARGESEPVKDCPNLKPKKRLVACLAPNRRVVIDVAGAGNRQ